MTRATTQIAIHTQGLTVRAGKAKLDQIGLQAACLPINGCQRCRTCLYINRRQSIGALECLDRLLGRRIKRLVCLQPMTV
ncbi:hypothetical protein XAXN_15120 [Xanthomonas axonopodis]|uniref:Uncharacterized protein n=1 Tax=Xanthomonas axonopodis TaxID=53413 RepID=A0A0P6V949_9XANT|nr:hypothetical protein XAXN_15120 [Xanthomonas axonopodis]